MNRLSIARVIAVFCSGLMAGLLFGDWLGPSFARSAMNVPSFVQFQQIVHINYLLTLPALSTLALAAPILWLVMLRNRRDALNSRSYSARLSRSPLALRSRFVFNVPINNQLETWNLAAPPPNARDIWSGWEKAHVVRTVFWVLGFLLETVALGVVERPLQLTSEGGS